MARLNFQAFASDTATAIADDDEDNDELPDLYTLLQRLSHHHKQSHTEASVISSGFKKVETGNEEYQEAAVVETADVFHENRVGKTAKAMQKSQRGYFVGGETNKENNNREQVEISAKRKPQRPLRLAHVNSLLLLPVGRRDGAGIAGFGGVDEKDTSNKTGGLRGNGISKGTRERMRNDVLTRVSVSSSSSSSSESEKEGEITEGSSDHLSDFVVDDSASEFDEIKLPRIRIPKEWKHTSPRKDGRAGAGGICPIPDGNLANWRASPTKSISGQPVGGAGRHIYAEPGQGLKLYEAYLPII